LEFQRKIATFPRLILILAALQSYGMIRLLNSRHLENILAALAAFVAFLVYLSTLCPTTNFIDSGELSTDAYTLGIAHPTGYPLFTLIGWIFAHLPLGLRVVYQLNMMAAFFCALALFVFFKFLVFFVRLVADRGNAREQSHQWTLYVPAMAGTLLLGFSETFWSQATAIEVYSLHCFFVALLLLLFLRAILQGSRTERGERIDLRGWYLFAFILGLAFTNHMTTVLLAPAFLFLYFSTFRFSNASWKRLARMSIPFLLGFSVYLYLLIRASEHPTMNWGNPENLERFLWHFSGKQYRVWIFASTESAMKQLQYFIDTLLPEFAYVPVIFAAVGLWFLLTRNRKLAAFTLLLFLGCILYSINYDIHDIDSYFLLAYFTVTIWCSLGIRYIMMSLRDGRVRFVFSVSTLLLVGVVAYFNYSRLDESKTFLVEDYTRDMFNSIDRNGIVISYQWDYFVSAAYYFQLVEKERTDIVVVDKELLRRSWYYAQLEARYPWLIDGSRKEVDAFLVELRKFERGLPYNPNLIEARFNSVIHSFIGKNHTQRPVYATGEIETQYTSGYQRVPSGLAFRLYNDTLVHQAPLNSFLLRKPSRTNQYVEGLVGQYARAYLNHAIYAYLGGDSAAAEVNVDKALEVQPTFPEAMDLKSRLAKGG